MVNWEADPRPFVPSGWVLADNPFPNPLLQHKAYVMGCYKLQNEGLAIVKRQPPVSKEDFSNFSTTLHAFFEQMH